MRYHYEKPTIYLSMYGKLYICEHPVYNSCTLFQINDKGLSSLRSITAPQRLQTAYPLFRYSINSIPPLMFYGIWMKKGFKFEETGTYTSTTFRGLFNRFRPTRK